jgi:hypothetical protein
MDLAGFVVDLGSRVASARVLVGIVEPIAVYRSFDIKPDAKEGGPACVSGVLAMHFASVFVGFESGLIAFTGWQPKGGCQHAG